MLSISGRTDSLAHVNISLRIEASSVGGGRQDGGHIEASLEVLSERQRWRLNPPLIEHCAMAGGNSSAATTTFNVGATSGACPRCAPRALDSSFPHASQHTRPLPSRRQRYISPRLSRLRSQFEHRLRPLGPRIKGAKRLRHVAGLDGVLGIQPTAAGKALDGLQQRLGTVAKGGVVVVDAQRCRAIFQPLRRVLPDQLPDFVIDDVFPRCACVRS